MSFPKLLHHDTANGTTLLMLILNKQKNAFFFKYYQTKFQPCVCVKPLKYIGLILKSCCFFEDAKMTIILQLIFQFKKGNNHHRRYTTHIHIHFLTEKGCTQNHVPFTALGTLLYSTDNLQYTQPPQTHVLYALLDILWWWWRIRWQEEGQMGWIKTMRLCKPRSELENST